MLEFLSMPAGAALVAGCVHFLIGALWYSPAGFGGPWMRGRGITAEDIAEARVDMRSALGVSALASPVQAGALVALFAMLGVPGILAGLLIGGLAGFAFDADVVRFFKRLGPGYQWRMNEVLRAYVHGRMAKIVKGPDTTDYILHPERIPEDPEFWKWGQAEASLTPPPETPPTSPQEARAKAESAARVAAHQATIDQRAQATFDAWKVKAAEADAKGEPRPPLF